MTAEDEIVALKDELKLLQVRVEGLDARAEVLEGTSIGESGASLNAGVESEKEEVSESSSDAEAAETAVVLASLAARVRGLERSSLTGAREVYEPKLLVEENSDGVPVGVIVLWSGSEDAVPEHWALCNSANHSVYPSIPNLSDRFIVGAGSTYEIGASGGASATIANHEAHHHHPFFRAAWVRNDAENTPVMPEVTEDAYLSAHSLTAVMPIYYALAYIIKYE